MTQHTQHHHIPHHRLPVWPSLALLVALVATCLVLLALPVKMPVGAMYWDVFLYLDAAQRISDGQIPGVDFFAPVGALGYYMAAAALKLFPDGQPLLAVSWSILALTVPLMAMVTYDSGKRAPLTALAVTIPFVLFSFLPFNTTISNTFPGSDAFAIYNRQTSQLLYIVVAAAVFVRSQWLMAITIGIAMTALFFLKITGFLSAGLVCLLALLAGRIRVRATAAAIITFIVLVGAAEVLMRGLVTTYIGDIATLVSMNQDGLLRRMVQSASKTAGTTLSTAILGLVVFAATWPMTRAALTKHDWRNVLDHPSVWLATVLLAGLFFESQNTGGQELVYLWPVIIMLVAAIQIPGPRPVVTGTTLMLAACVALPPTVATVQAALRSTLGSLIQQPVVHTHLRQLGNITTREYFAKRADEVRQIYIDYPDVQQAYVEAGELPAFHLYADFDFQLLLHLNADELVGTLKRLEADGLRYESVLNMDFSNPFGWLLNKDAPKHVAIGASVGRTVPPLDDLTAKAVSDVDLALIPLCPFGYQVAVLLQHYEIPLASHKRVSLTPCFDALVHPRIDFEF